MENVDSKYLLYKAGCDDIELQGIILFWILADGGPLSYCKSSNVVAACQEIVRMSDERRVGAIQYSALNDFSCVIDSFGIKNACRKFDIVRSVHRVFYEERDLDLESCNMLELLEWIPGMSHWTAANFIIHTRMPTSWWK